ncbi:S-Ena type endospore appendage [Paenibacillus sp. Soil787]|uniref:S-Ena type endospore appendage n=1 Tax=Paenibacillus sp. Soil787 TaxID=1736411 RepID=UPI000703B4B3|nr:S-Ena type endospore appendage [Paenibacillus sp. Soil787]KRF13456.1 hypothetical protein ASG93_13040 [Paenibacillus sp. Soil787]
MAFNPDGNSFISYPISQGPGVGKGYYSSQTPGITALVLVENDSANITLTVQVRTYSGDNISFEVLPGSTYSFNINSIQLIGILSSSGTGPAVGTLAIFPFFGFPLFANSRTVQG